MNMLAQTVFNSTFGVPFFAIIGVFLVSTLYPINRRLPFARLAATCSLFILPLWWVYESTLPSHMNIRIDLFVIIPIVLTALAVVAKRTPWLLQKDAPPTDP